MGGGAIFLASENGAGGFKFKFVANPNLQKTWHQQHGKRSTTRSDTQCQVLHQKRYTQRPLGNLQNPGTFHPYLGADHADDLEPGFKPPCPTPIVLEKQTLNEFDSAQNLMLTKSDANISSVGRGGLLLAVADR